MGLEPTRPLGQGILSPLRLTIPPLPHKGVLGTGRHPWQYYAIATESVLPPWMMRSRTTSMGGYARPLLTGTPTRPQSWSHTLSRLDLRTRLYRWRLGVFTTDISRE